MKKLWKKMVIALGKAPSNTQDNVKKEDNSNYNYEQIPNTPFIHVKDVDQGWYIVMADTRITEPTHNKAESLKQIEDINWKTLTVVIATIVQKVIEKREEEVTKKVEEQIQELTKQN
jgi:hypothetical protein